MHTDVEIDRVSAERPRTAQDPEHGRLHLSIGYEREKVSRFCHRSSSQDAARK